MFLLITHIFVILSLFLRNFTSLTVTPHLERAFSQVNGCDTLKLIFATDHASQMELQ